MLCLVLDTNVVLDLLFWNDPAATPLIDAFGEGSARAITDTRCFEELQQVLRLDRFELDLTAQQALALRYRDICQWHDTPAMPARSLPRCKDPDDQKFLELALSADADLLVTKDKALLALARRRQALGRLAIVAPQFAVRRLAAQAAVA
ncbi:MAG: putative toxin-antitoxin system toxin component, PIN family [Sterolibacteriaceae bacterium]|nr:putative toxin-antitoxin system toxin component, PIN family [Sterolibacteriaceae bacterium]MBK9085095.1 putative toxin-antitoxin system toxin component, PIN family [Sterolibacteriaceae bacterium]